MKRLLLTFIFLATHICYAQDTNSRDSLSSSQFRDQHVASLDLQYSLLSLPFPGSKGASFNLNLGKDWQLVLDYMSTGVEVNFSKLNLAGFNEKQLGLKIRRYFGNSFNLGFGYVRRSNEIYLDPNVYGINTSNINARTEAYSNLAHFSLSNRWQYNHWSAGIEWLSINIPFSGGVTQSIADLTTNNDEKTDIRNAEDVLTWYPNLAIMTLNLGYMF